MFELAKRKKKYNLPRNCKTCGVEVKKDVELRHDLLTALMAAVYEIEGIGGELFCPGKMCGECQRNVVRKIVDDFNEKIKKILEGACE